MLGALLAVGELPACTAMALETELPSTYPKSFPVARSVMLLSWSSEVVTYSVPVAAPIGLPSRSHWYVVATPALSQVGGVLCRVRPTPAPSDATIETAAIGDTAPSTTNERVSLTPMTWLLGS